MMVMPSNNSSGLVHYLAGKYPGKIGWLMGPGDFKRPRFYLPYALDNDAYSAFQNGTPWNEAAFFGLLDKCRMQPTKPLWVAVPDVVANRKATLANWAKYAPRVAAYGWPMAFVVQDGMTPGDVLDDAALVFVGGSTEWKWHNLKMWTDHCPRVHVGRVNEGHRLYQCERLGVESVDGTGWFRGTSDGRQATALLNFFEGYSSHQLPLPQLTE